MDAADRTTLGKPTLPVGTDLRLSLRSLRSGHTLEELCGQPRPKLTRLASRRLDHHAPILHSTTEPRSASPRDAFPDIGSTWALVASDHRPYLVFGRFLRVDDVSSQETTGSHQDASTPDRNHFRWASPVRRPHEDEPRRRL